MSTTENNLLVAYLNHRDTINLRFVTELDRAQRAASSLIDFRAEMDRLTKGREAALSYAKRDYAQALLRLATGEVK